MAVRNGMMIKARTSDVESYMCHLTGCVDLGRQADTSEPECLRPEEDADRLERWP